MGKSFFAGEMATIHELDTELINKIAAGEVVERPASVVKELVENALDAGAKTIRVGVRDAGSSLIRVVDDGSGMTREDALLAPKRHTTSKLASADDLFSIETLGFRGEALASIAAVSRMKIRTRSADEEVGTEVTVTQDSVTAADAAVPKGTSVEVADLFCNTPARRKHLKSPATEMRHIIDLVQRYTLAYPEVSFTLISGGQETLSAPASSDQLAAVVAIYGSKFAKELLPVHFENPYLTVSGFISKPTLTKPNTQHQSIYINRRFVTNQTISRAVNDAYHTLMHLDRKPVAILNIRLSPKHVDVNVHPTKREVRLSHEEMVYQAVFEAVRKTLSENQLISSEEFPTQHILQSAQSASRQGPVTGSVGGAVVTGATQAQVARDAQSSARQIEHPAVSALSQEHLGPVTTEVAGTERFPDLKVIGQLHNTYVLTESEDGLCVVDQHAAQERVFYEKYMEHRYAEALQTQQLLSPVVLELSPSEMRLVEENREILKELGYELEQFGPNAVVAATAPVLFGKVQQESFFRDLISELANCRDLSRDKREERIIRMSCKSAVKANDPLSLAKMKEILTDLSICRMPFTCPHGRPTLFRVTLHEFEKRFKRVG